MLEAGADVTATNNQLRTPADLAERSYYHQVAALLTSKMPAIEVQPPATVAFEENITWHRTGVLEVACVSVKNCSAIA